SDKSSMKAVTSCDQTNRGILCSVMPGARMLKIVVMKLIAPRIEAAPAKWIDKIAKSTAGPGWPILLESGATKIQPAPAPSASAVPGRNNESSSSESAPGKSQNEMLFMRGKAISGAP